MIIFLVEFCLVEEHINFLEFFLILITLMAIINPIIGRRIKEPRKYKNNAKTKTNDANNKGTLLFTSFQDKIIQFSYLML